MRNFFYLLVLATFFVASCEKREEIVLDNAAKLSLSQDQLVMIEKMDEASKILSKMVLNQDVLNEVSAMVNKKMYSDDFVFFEDLFYPQRNALLKSARMDFSVFEAEFDKNYDLLGLKSGAMDDLKNYLIENNLVLYVPYPLDDYSSDNQIPSISFHPLLNDSTNYGYEPIPPSSGKSATMKSYDVVDINEEYSVSKPLYLILPLEPEDPIVKDTPIPQPKNKLDEISIGHVYLRNQLDGLFSGGSELRFEKGGINVSADGHVTGVFDNILGCNISRSTIRYASKGWEKGFVNLNAVWETNWKPEELELVFAVWEEDDKSERTLTLGGKTTYGTDVKLDSFVTAKAGQEFNYTVSKKFYSQDEVIYALAWDRNWFFATNKIDNGWSFRGAFTRDGFSYRVLRNDLIITMKHRELYY